MSEDEHRDTAGFETLLKKLEDTVHELEAGELGLDRSLETYRQGVDLLARCYGMLEVAERRVEMVVGVGEDGRPALAPFRPGRAEPVPTSTAGEPRQDSRAGRDEMDDLPF